MPRSQPSTVRAAGVALLLFVAAPLGVGGAGACPTSEAEALRVVPAAPATDEARAERRILRLADGRVLRGAARPATPLAPADPLGRGGLASAGDWEVKDGDLWRRVPCASIARVCLERDALADYARFARGIPPLDLSHRLSLCGWLATEGLLPELAQELDRVLAADPDQATALRLIAESGLADRLPPPDPDPARERARDLREGAKGAPVERELWIARLAVLGDRPALLEAFARELASGVDARRDFAAHALRRIAPGAHLATLEERALADTSRPVRDEARRALRDARDPVVVTHLAPRVESATLKERLGAIDSLGVAGYEAALEPLVAHLAALAKPAAGSGGGGGVPRSHLSVRNTVAYVQDYNVEIAQAASIADPIVNFCDEGTTLDVACATWQMPVRQYETAVTMRALSRIVGDRTRRKPEDWLRWWDERNAAGGATSSAPRSAPEPASNPRH